MKCFKCGKNFDYEKYYGICPKCGCYNKQETPQEQHQQLHDQYDQGYTHGPGGYQQGNGYPGGYQQGNGYPGGSQQGSGYPVGPRQGSGYPSRPQPTVMIHEVKSWRNQKGGTAFLVISVLVFFLVLIGGTIFTVQYSVNKEERVQQELLDFVPETQVHEPGASFAFQDLQLSVSEAQLLATREDVDLPLGKKLVAVRLTGSGDGKWKDENRLPELYIRTEEDVCYWQVSFYDYEFYGEIFRREGFEAYALCDAREMEGWAAFLVDEDQSRITLCLEEREGQYRKKITRIHQVTLEISEETDGQ